MDIREMEAGEELEILVAKKIFRLNFKKNRNYVTGWEVDGFANELERYSRDMNAAMRVFTHFGWQGSIVFSGSEWYCEIMWGFDKSGSGSYVKAEGYTAAEAICKTGLLAQAELAKEES